MQSSESIELATRLHPQAEPEQRNESSLAPVDKGFGAWSFLVGAFAVETVVWGYPVAYGTFLNAYLNDPKYVTQPHASLLLPLVGPLSSGIIYCSGTVVNPIMARYPFLKRPAMWLGTILCFLSLLGASFTNKVLDLLVLQGVLYAIGGSLLYAPCLGYMTEWFVERRGLANGVIFAGTAIGGFFFPLVIPRLLNRYGISMALRILSFALIGSLLPFLPFIKGRLPESRVHGPIARPRDVSWLKSTAFWVVVVANTLQGFAYFVPLVWLPTFASSLNVSPTNASLTLALLNGTSVVSRLGLGFLSDKVDPWGLALSTLVFACFSTFVLWGVLSHTFAGLLAFGIAYGTIAGGWTCLWTAFIRPIAKDDPTLATSLFGYLLLSRGLGNVLSTPISTSLVNGYNSMAGMREIKTGFDVAGGRFEKMIVYVGTCFAGAAVVLAIGWVSGVSKALR
ncbi:hypothetical protein HYDPIDRAFT_181709 [Hydnomerulius pinastri MD-312]|uniref:MFS general substrate transporter n=1 Tax=Hydnomerulius pinastri MD-312 TaxID=994086 RepID=A0A0C9W0U5_9AGAM|nr:hypothetical protein HYDPIDRAFT_181709 [Hydnomerulius pinastri MD-312]